MTRGAREGHGAAGAGLSRLAAGGPGGERRHLAVCPASRREAQRGGWGRWLCGRALAPAAPEREVEGRGWPGPPRLSLAALRPPRGCSLPGWSADGRPARGRGGGRVAGLGLQ